MLGPSEEASREGFVAMLREEALLAASAVRAGLPARFEVAEVQRRALARAWLDRAGEAVGPASAIPDAEVKAYYEAHASTYEQPARVQVWRILVKTESRARELLAKVKAGVAVADWVTLAREESVDEATKLRGGNLGFLDERGISDDAPVSADPAVVDAVRALPDGAVAPEPVAERGYFGVVWRRSSLPSIRRTIVDVAPAIRATLWRERRARAEDAAVKAAVAARVSLRNDDALTAIDPVIVKAYEARHRASR
jgi:peptidyl-prolyl cis-trans isomerase C